jgi:hypothetical protein
MPVKSGIFQPGDLRQSELNRFRRGKEGSATAYRVRNLYATISATMLAKISRARRDFRVVGLIVADRMDLSLGGLPFSVGLRACGSGAAPTPPISL